MGGWGNERAFVIDRKYGSIHVMKYELETIPVWDGVKSGSECFLCDLMTQAEEHAVSFYLGSSVMNPETRVKVNEQGFCRAHFAKLVAAGKPQALALICDTYLARSRKLLAGPMEAIVSAKPGRKLDGAVRSFSSALESRERGCLVCDQMQGRLDRYCFTTAYLWGQDDDFRHALAESKGVCLPHLDALLVMSAQALDASHRADFCKALIDLTNRNLDRIAADVLWMTQKYKSENIDKPWNGCEDAHKRAVFKMVGQDRN